MQRDERDLLEVLKFELKFLEDGGYGRSPRSPWRPQYIFEDSPTCMNYDAKENRAPCSACVLMDLVPPEFRSEKIPCRHIPLNASRETLDSAYRHRNEAEIEEAVADWLRATIQGLQEERLAARQGANKPPIPQGKAIRGIPLYQKQHPKCANPACPTAFHWTGGGKFFRFRSDALLRDAIHSPADLSHGIHGVRHYWLCERCCHVFTLVYGEQCGVVLKVLWPELPTSEVSNGEFHANLPPA